MKAGQALKTAGYLSAFLIRHLVATAVIVVTPCVVWTVCYFALLIWAIIVDGGVGSPLVYPLGLVFFATAGTLMSLLLFLPATAEWLARWLNLPVLVQIPLSVAVLAALCFVTVLVMSERTFQGLSFNFALLYVLMLLPMGLYWWVALSGPLLVALLSRINLTLARRRRVGE